MIYKSILRSYFNVIYLFSSFLKYFNFHRFFIIFLDYLKKLDVMKQKYEFGFSNQKSIRNMYLCTCTLDWHYCQKIFCTPVLLTHFNAPCLILIACTLCSQYIRIIYGIISLHIIPTVIDLINLTQVDQNT